MKKIIILCILVAFQQNILAQTSYKFDSESYDFGEIFEGDGATHIFNVTNTGTEPLVISQVRPSCGCTTPEWSTDPILPGKSGTIKANYNTQGRVGFFNKSIEITTNGDVAYTTVYIKGSVIPKSEKKYTDVEIKLSPKIILEKEAHNFGKVEKGAKLPVRIKVTNLGRSDLKIYQIVAACGCVSINSKQEFIKSGESGTIEVVYSPTGSGEQTDVAYIRSNDILNPSQRLSLSAKIVDALQPTLMKENVGGSVFK